MASRQSIIRQRYIRDLKKWGSVICGICDLPIIMEKDLTVDHIIPKSKGGSNRVDNLQPAHKHCNKEKDNQENFKKELIKKGE